MIEDFDEHVEFFFLFVDFFDGVGEVFEVVFDDVHLIFLIEGIGGFGVHLVFFDVLFDVVYFFFRYGYGFVLVVEEVYDFWGIFDDVLGCLVGGMSI